ncbi:ankyrin repeat domain-containing protein 50 [Achaetomium macrosporum]|uniref:Ankyrin repeat domain-containing protein 50 n=1 Tax=Achaetomium macrosporum TaxID=79813 RepID=A0AAN7CGF6_9PEZI|nr:ankyrin repeat domain-containing protein 50 [Achaetomium macrosporum]
MNRTSNIKARQPTLSDALLSTSEDPVPAYTQADTTPLTTLLDALPSLSMRLQLPLTSYPAPLQPTWNSTVPTTTNPLASDPTLTESEKKTLYRTQQQIIASFFHGISSRNIEAVTLFVQRGLVSPDVPDSPAGRTPLIAAVEAGDGAMVCTLIGLGARVDGWGWTTSITTTTSANMEKRQRTALMVAASRGNLALVRLLREDFGADDAAIAPDDGQLALRLAAEAGHRDVVEYLPARRGGAWRRWKAHHAVAMARARRAARGIYVFFKVLLYHVPRFFLWDIPKHAVVRPLGKAGKWCWVNKHRLGPWCKRQVREFPGRVKRAGKAVWKGAKMVPRGVWGVVKEIPGVMKRLLRWLWTVIIRIPVAMKQVCVWIWESLKRVGKAAGHVFLRIVVALHTAVAAVLDFFKSIKLQDVWNGVCDVYEAVCFGLPRALWKGIVSAGAVAAGVIIALFGLTAKLVVFLMEALWCVAKYVPRQLGVIISAIWGSVAKGYHEILVWINPKY